MRLSQLHTHDRGPDGQWVRDDSNPQTRRLDRDSRRFRIRYSLGAMFAAVTVVSISAGLWANYVHKRAVIVDLVERSGGGVQFSSSTSVLNLFSQPRRMTIFWDNLSPQETSLIIRAAAEFPELEEIQFFTGDDQDLLELLTESPVRSMIRRSEVGLLPSRLRSCESDLARLRDRLPSCAITMDLRRWPTPHVSRAEVLNRFRSNAG
jgi:hypothetical protein